MGRNGQRPSRSDQLAVPNDERSPRSCHLVRSVRARTTVRLPCSGSVRTCPRTDRGDLPRPPATHDDMACWHVIDILLSWNYLKHSELAEITCKNQVGIQRCMGKNGATRRARDAMRGGGGWCETPIPSGRVPRGDPSPPRHRGEGLKPCLSCLSPHTGFRTLAPPKTNPMEVVKSPAPAAQQLTEQETKRLEQEAKRKQRARRRDRRNLADFAERAIYHADKTDLAAIIIAVHPDDDTEQKCIIMNTASDQFTYEAIMAIITSNQRVGMQVIATMMRNMKEYEVPPAAFQEGDIVTLVAPDDSVEEGSFKDRMQALAGTSATVFASNEEHTIVELPDGERLRYDVKFLIKQADGSGDTEGGGPDDGPQAEAGEAAQAPVEGAQSDEPVREVLQDPVQEPLGDGEVRGDAGPSPDGAQL